MGECEVISQLTLTVHIQEQAAERSPVPSQHTQTQTPGQKDRVEDTAEY